MLFAGWQVRMVKNCDRGLENAARGRSQAPEVQTTKQTLTTSKHLIEFTYSDLPF